MTENQAAPITSTTTSTQTAAPAAPASSPPDGGAPALPPQGGANGAAAPKAEDNFAARFAHLTKKEREIVKREGSIKDQVAKITEFEQIKANARKNPLAYLQAGGIDYDYLTNHILSDGKPRPEDQITELAGTVKTLEEKIEADKKAAAEAKIAEEDAHIKRALGLYQSETESFIDQNPDKYELILAKGQKAEVFSLIEQYFYEFGKVLTPEQAADKIENALLEEAKQLLALKKVAPLVQPQAAGTQPASAAVRVSPSDVHVSSAPSPTITNATMPSSSAPAGPPLSQEERKKRAAALLRYTDE